MSFSFFIVLLVKASWLVRLESLRSMVHLISSLNKGSFLFFVLILFTFGFSLANMAAISWGSYSISTDSTSCAYSFFLSFWEQELDLCPSLPHEWHGRRRLYGSQGNRSSSTTFHDMVVSCEASPGVTCFLSLLCWTFLCTSRKILHCTGQWSGSSHKKQGTWLVGHSWARFFLTTQKGF